MDVEKESSKLQITIEIEKTRGEECGSKSQQGGRGSKSKKIGTSQRLQMVEWNQRQGSGSVGKVMRLAG